ncbi:MAG: Lon protease 2 [Alphaproteobacteria bacterium MarineAlpha10_Bin3]|jgi:Lon protease-like protein|nr:MAG: Lon protease 2 [Alphaproteobacteria bacterium MarineAlpha10_Bin3]PPR69237.1 MAG: Lon protease 2 [Alphaproteobacteria bacterium MarineAlpha4_Bin1]
MSPFDPDFGDLPAALPIFPLTGVLLLPRGTLPLNIFEPRYMNMITDALASDRMVGMVQPSTVNAEAHEGEPAVYQTGCAGRIIHFEETDDGRFILSLKGVSRFAIVEEIPTIRGYRKCTVDWDRFRGDLAAAAAEFDRQKLIGAVRSYFSVKGIQADWAAIERAEDEALVTSIAMLCPFDPPEKQALLEAADLTARAELLTAVVEMAAHDQPGGTRQ